MGTLFALFLSLAYIGWLVGAFLRIFTGGKTRGSRSFKRHHPSNRDEAAEMYKQSRQNSPPIRTSSYTSSKSASYDERPPWGTERYVQYYCIYNMRDQLNYLAKSRCFNPSVSAYEAYTDGERWLILNQLHDEYVRRFPISVSKGRMYGEASIRDRMSTLRPAYEAELEHLTRIRDNLKSYFTAHPHGLRKDAVKAFVRKSDNQAEFYLYYKILTSFERAHVLITRRRNNTIEYTYVGSAMRAILDFMQHTPVGLQKNLLNQLCPKKAESPLNRRSYTFALSHMQKLNMITLEKDNAGFIRYTLLSPVPRPVKIGAQSDELVSFVQNKADDYMLRKALFTINAPAMLDRQQRYAAFISLRDLSLYHTSLQACTCPAFAGSKLPCKHMIRLALDLNLVHFFGEQRRFHEQSKLGYSEDWFTQFI